MRITEVLYEEFKQQQIFQKKKSQKLTLLFLPNDTKNQYNDPFSRWIILILVALIHIFIVLHCDNNEAKKKIISILKKNVQRSKLDWKNHLRGGYPSIPLTPPPVLPIDQGGGGLLFQPRLHWCVHRPGPGLGWPGPAWPWLASRF